MTSPNHTPAPWKAGSKSVTAPETDERLGLDVRIFGGNGADNRANAKLIAAAPELLKAVRAFIHYNDIGDDIDAMLAYAEALELARSALKKTEGAA